jgi:hypothetical protein
MKYVVALMAIVLAAVLAVTCQTMPVTKGAQSQPQPSPATATLFAGTGPAPAPGPVTVNITVLGSGFLTSTNVQLEMCGAPWGDPVPTNSCGCFNVTLPEPAGVTGQVYAIEAYVDSTLWATFPWMHS